MQINGSFTQFPMSVISGGLAAPGERNPLAVLRR
jgi:hypothetical protein